MPNTVTQADALDYLRSLPDQSVDLVCTDPPYFRVKAEWWDRQWDTQEGFLHWIDLLAHQWARVLKPSGSLYCFASPQMAAHVEVTIGKRLKVLNGIVWVKPAARHNQACKETLRAFFPQTERIVFAEHAGSDLMAKGESSHASKCNEPRGFLFEPIRAYLDGERQRAGVTSTDFDREWQNHRGNKSRMVQHWFTSSQFSLPTEKNYEWLRSILNRSGGDYLAREYEDLRREYEELKCEYESLRRPFSVTKDVPYTDVWVFPTVPSRPDKHPCEKPAELIRHIIRSSTRPGAVVLDSFAGSGVVGQVAVEEGRTFLGSEIDEHWCRVANERITGAQPSR